MIEVEEDVEDNNEDDLESESDGTLSETGDPSIIESSFSFMDESTPEILSLIGRYGQYVRSSSFTT